MSLKKKSIGTGITKRPITHVDPTDVEAVGEFLRIITKDPIAEARDFCTGLAGDFKTERRDAVQQFLAATTANEKSKAMSELAALNPDIDTEQWFAIEVLNHLDWAESNRKQGKHRSAASLDFQAGVILGVAAMKFTWEHFAELGEKIEQAVNHGGEIEHKKALKKYAKYRNVIDSVREENPRASKGEVYRIAMEKTGVSLSTLKRAEKKRVNPLP